MLPLTSTLPPTFIVQSPPAIETWSQAFSLWLDSRPAPNTRRAYRKAWEFLLAFAFI